MNSGTGSVFLSVFLSDNLGGKWTSSFDWLYVISNLMVWSACLILPILVALFIIKKGKNDMFFSNIYVVFAGFLFVVGLTFLGDTVVFLKAFDELGLVLRLLTGVVSWIVVFYSLSILPKSLNMKSRKELMDEITIRAQMEYELKVRNERLMEAERNVRLGYIYWDIVCDRVEMSDMAADVLDINISSQGATFAEIMQQLTEKQADVVQDFIENKLLKLPTLTSYFRLTTSQNEERYILVKADVIRNSMGDPVIVKGTIQNVSELRELQKMDEQKQKLKKIAWVQSHRMRSPVASILGMANLFNYTDPSDPVNTEILNNIKELTLNLDSMIHEVDELTREKGKEHAA